MNTQSTSNISPSHTWKYGETINLIKCMATHIEDLNHARKRKDVFEHVANDLLSMRQTCECGHGSEQMEQLDEKLP